MRQLSIDRLIVYHTLIFFPPHPDGDSLCSCSWPRTGLLGGLGEENTVRNRDTWRLIETSQDIYLYDTVRRTLHDETQDQRKNKNKKQSASQ